MKTQIAEVFIQCNGAIAGTPDKPTFHIKVLDVAENMDEVATLGGIARRERVLNMAQCREQGIKLGGAIEETAQAFLTRAEIADAERDAAVADRNTAVDAYVEALAGQAEADNARRVAEAVRDAAIADRAEAINARNLAEAERDAAFDDRDATIAAEAALEATVTEGSEH